MVKNKTKLAKGKKHSKTIKDDGRKEKANKRKKLNERSSENDTDSVNNEIVNRKRRTSNSIDNSSGEESSGVHHSENENKRLDASKSKQSEKRLPMDKNKPKSSRAKKQSKTIADDTIKEKADEENMLSEDSAENHGIVTKKRLTGKTKYYSSDSDSSNDHDSDYQNKSSKSSKENVKKIVCKKCDTIFNTRLQLSKHLLSKHSKTDSENNEIVNKKRHTSKFFDNSSGVHHSENENKRLDASKSKQSEKRLPMDKNKTKLSRAKKQSKTIADDTIKEKADEENMLSEDSAENDGIVTKKRLSGKTKYYSSDSDSSDHHDSNNQNKSSKSSKENVKKIVCKKCDTTFNTHLQLSKHLLSRHSKKPLKCVICREAFKSLTLFSNHMKSDHPEVERYPCDYHDCSLSFHTQKKLRDHQKAHYRFSCRFCKKGFILKRRMLYHVEREHH